MTAVSLVLHPGAERNRSMVLYAERLAGAAPADGDWRVRRLPRLPMDRDGRLSEIVVPPLALRRPRTGVVHVVDHAHCAYTRWARQPTVVTVHDLIPLKARRGDYPPQARAEVSRRAATWLAWNLRHLDRAARVVTPSAATAGDLARLLNVEATVVPHGIDTIFHEPPAATTDAAITARLGELSDRPLLLSVASNYFYKNLPAVVATFDSLARHRDDLVWVHVGAPLPADLAARVAAAPWHERCCQLGVAEAAELAALYRRASVLLFPSWDEGFGWPPLEAMAAGCPVVTSNRGALAETAVPAALTAPPDDPEALAVLVRRVLHDPGLADDLRTRGRAHAGRYRWSDTAARMAAIYAEAECA